MAGCNNGPKMAAGRYSGADLSGKAEVVRTHGAAEAQVAVTVGTSWQLYAGESDQAIDFTTPVASGDNGSTVEFAVDPARRTYFQFTTPDGKAILAERRLPLEGGANYRDMGGYRTADGHYVRWGKVFRTDDMHRLTQADLAYLSAIPIATIVDFRSAQEIADGPDLLPQSVRSHIELSISPGNLSDAEDIMTAEDAARYMADMNVLMVTDSAIIEKYREFFALLQDEENLPLSFHCTAGKDRTGMGAALFLASLGVDEQTIMKDYLLSNKYLEPKYGAITTMYPHLKPMMTVDASYLGAGLAAIKEQHGTVENYLRNVLGVDIAKMRKIYLYK